MGTPLSAALVWPDFPIARKAYFFRGSEYIRYDLQKDNADRFYPKDIGDHWPGIWADGFDSAVVWDNGKAYFFRGHEYIRYDIEKDRADSGYPRKIAPNWPGLWSGGIDAAVKWNEKKAYFFKGDEYIRFDLKKDAADPGYPRKIAGNWDGVWADGIDAVAVWDNGKAYFFKGNEYVRVDVATKKADAGYPRKIAKSWKGIWEVRLFSYEAKNVPDTDQRWSGLPNGGALYCVPTAAFNWLWYLYINAKESTVELPASNPKANVAVWNISRLGDYMDTNPYEDGTSYDDAVDGLDEWLDDRGAGWVVNGYRFSDDQAITPWLLEHTVTSGGLVNLCYGRYIKDGDEYERDGGHCVTLVGISESGESYKLTVRDPNTGKSDSKTKQSARADRILHPVTISGEFDGEDTTVMRIASGKKVACIDTVVALHPKTAVTVLNGKVSWALSSAHGDLSGGGDGGDGGDGSSSALRAGVAPLPFSSEPDELAIHPVDPTLVVVADPDSGDIWQLDLITRRWSHLASAGRQGVHLTFGGRRTPRLYAAVGNELQELHARRGRRLRTKKMPFGVDALTWDATNARLIVASDADHRLARLDDGLRVKDTHELVAPPGDSRLQLTVARTDGTIVVSRLDRPGLATTRIRSASNVVTGAARLVTKGKVSAAHSDRRGNILAADNGRVAVFDRDGERLDVDPFPGFRVGRLLKVTRSWHNFDHEPAWRS